MAALGFEGPLAGMYGVQQAEQGIQQAGLTQDLTRQQIADYQALAGYRQAQTQKLNMEMQAIRDAQKLEAYIAQRRGAGAPAAPGMAAAPAAMGALAGTPAPVAAPIPGAAPAPTAAAPMPGAAPMVAPGAPMTAPGAPVQPTFMDQAIGAMNQMSTYASSQMALANEIEATGMPGAAARAAEMRKEALPMVKEMFVANKEMSQRVEADTRTAKLVNEQFDNLSSSLTPDKKGNISDAQVDSVRARLKAMLPPEASQSIDRLTRPELVAYVRDQARNSKAAVDKAKDRAQIFKDTQSGLKSQMDIYENQQLKALADQAAARIKAGDPDVKPWEATIDGQRRFAQKSAEVSAGGGAKSAIIEQRQDTLATNAMEFVKTLGNIRGLPMSSTGVMGRQTASSLFTAPLEAASNTLTTEAVQRYKTEMGGLGNHLAWMISGGLSPSVSVQNKFSDLLDIKEGDKPTTVLTKLARARQEADNVMAVKQQSRLISPEMKEMFGELRKELETTIPFTVNDVNTWANQRKNKKETFDEFIQRSGLSKGGAAQTVTVGDQTYVRPGNFTDAQWDAYKKAVGAK